MSSSLNNSPIGSGPNKTHGIHAEDASNLQNWFSSNPGRQGSGGIINSGWVDAALLDTNDDGRLSCTNEEGWIDDALSLWQIDSKVEALCIFGWYRTTATEESVGRQGSVTEIELKDAAGSYGDCVDGSKGNYLTNATNTGTCQSQGCQVVAPYSSTSPVTFLSRLKQARGIDINMNNTNDRALHLAILTLNQNAGCKAQRLGLYEEVSKDVQSKVNINDIKQIGTHFILKEVEGSGESASPVNAVYAFTGDRNKDSSVRVAPYLNGLYPLYEDWSPGESEGRLSCASLISIVNDLFNSVLASVKSGEVDVDETGTNSYNPCKKNPDSAECVSAEDYQTSCAIDGIGWIVCPVITFLADVADSAFGFLADNFLEIRASTFNTGGNNITYEMWSIVRNIANVAFVIVFLIIIFSQLTSMGVSNYGVKKMLPRLIVAAILVNTSYFLCQIAIDLSNILGYSIKAVFESISGIAFGGENAANVAAAKTFDLGGISSGLLLGGIAAVTLYVLLGALIPVLLGAVVALIMIFFILIARQALVILLVIVSPLAFVAYLLPNTESWFKKWRQALTAMLLLFPIIGAVFGASVLAADVLNSTFNATLGDDDGNQFFGQIIAAAVATLPLFVVPSLLKKSLDGVGNIGASIRSIGDRAGRGAKSTGEAGNKFAKQRYDNSTFAKARNLKKQGKETYRNRRFAEIMEEGGVRASLASGIALTKRGKYAQGSMQRVAQATAEKAGEEDISAAETLFRAGVTDPSQMIAEAGKAFAEAVSKGDTIKARATQKILLSSGGKGIEELDRQVGATFTSPAVSNSDTGMSVRRGMVAAGLKGRHAGLDSWGVNGGSYDAVKKSAGVYAGLNASEIAGQHKEALGAAERAGAISAEQARQVLDNPGVSQNLNPETRQILERIKNGQPAPPPPAPSQPPKIP